VNSLFGHKSSVDSTIFLPGGRFLVSGGGDASVIVWDAQLCVPVARRSTPGGGGIRGVVCGSRGGESVVVVANADGSSGHLTAWNLTDPARPAMLFHETHAEQPTEIAISGDGGRIAVGDNPGGIRVSDLVWDASLQLLPRSSQRVGGVEETVWDLTFLDPNGRWLAAACSREKATEHDGRGFLVGSAIADDPQARSYGTELGRVVSLTVSKDGSMLAAGLATGHVTLWRIGWEADEPRFALLADAPGHSAHVLCLAFHPDPAARRLASGSIDGTIRIWDTKELVGTITLHKHCGPVFDLSFDANGERLVTASGGTRGTDNVAWLWETGVDPSVVRKRAVATRAYAEVCGLLSSGLRIDEARRRIDHDAQLPEDAREFALVHFDEFVIHPRWLIDSAQRVLADPQGSTADLRMAREWIEQAHTIAPDRTDVQDLADALDLRIDRP